MNPILLKHLIHEFFSEYRHLYSDFIQELKIPRKDNHADEPKNEKIRLFQKQVKLKYFHEKFAAIARESEFSHADLVEFIKDSLLFFRENINYIESIFDSNRNLIEDNSFIAFQHTYNTNEIIKYLEFELTKIKESGLLTKDELMKSSIIKPKYSWENKTELSELIHVLYKSNRIKKDGLSIQKKELTQLLIDFFDLNDFEPSDLANKSAKTFKKGADGKTFINELNEIMNSYVKVINDKESN